MFNFVIPHSRSGSNSYLRLLEEGIAACGHRCTFADARAEPATDEVLWIHWPEDLAHYCSPDPQQAQKISEWLSLWRRENHVVWTVHNLHRHGMPHDAGFNHLYNLVAGAADVQMHHGKASIALARETFPRARPTVTTMAHHGGYFNLLGEATRESARAKLGLPAEARVLLIFGSIRAADEYQMAVEAAAIGWHVVIAGRTPSLGRRLRLKNWLRSRMTTLNITTHIGEIADTDVDPFVKAADALLIARSSSLNSGNIFLGMTFGRAVIGPNCGNMGEILRARDNFVFDPADLRDLRHVLRFALRADLDPVGERNAAWIQAHGRWENVAEAAVAAVQEVAARGSVAHEM